MSAPWGWGCSEAPRQWLPVTAALMAQPMGRGTGGTTDLLHCTWSVTLPFNVLGYLCGKTSLLSARKLPTDETETVLKVFSPLASFQAVSC